MGKNLKGKELGKGISQRPDGRYEARAIISGVKIDIYNIDLNKLKEEFIRAKEAVKQNNDIKYANITLNEWFDEWFDKYKKPALKPSSAYPTIRRYNTIFRDEIGNIQLSEIRSIHVQEAITKIANTGKAISTIRSGLSTLRDCLNSAVNNKLMASNPILDVILPWRETQKAEYRFLSWDEMNVFLDQVDTNYYKEMFYVMFCTGMRIGEIGGLQWCDVDFKKKVININHSLSCQYHGGVKRQVLTTPKTSNSYREIPFLGECEEMLKSWKAKQDSYKKYLGNRWRNTEFGDLVFTTTMGSPVTRYIVEKEINKVVAEINAKAIFEGKPHMERIYPHAIRHTFCSMCFEKGMSPKVVQTIMGHANFTTTMDIYTHVTKEKFTDDTAKFGSSLRNLIDSTQIES